VTASSRLDFHNMGFYFLHSTKRIGCLFEKRMHPKYKGHIYGTRQLETLGIPNSLS
jgi:hypothetical protein